MTFTAIRDGSPYGVLPGASWNKRFVNIPAHSG